MRLRFMKKNILTLFVFSAILLSGVSCRKKISKYPFDIYGIWYSENGSCGAFLDLREGLQGKFYGDDGENCPAFKEVKGKVKYKKDILYIDREAFTIFDEPTVAGGNDSIWVPDQNTFGTIRTGKKYRVIATMKLQSKKTKFEFEKTYNFSKYLEY